MQTFDTELKQVIRTIVGDIRVDVNITFYPVRPTHDMQELLTIDQINARLAGLGGEFSYEIQKMVKGEIKDSNDCKCINSYHIVCERSYNKALNDVLELIKGEEGIKTEKDHVHESSGMACLVLHKDGHGQCSKCKTCGEWY